MTSFFFQIRESNAFKSLVILCIVFASLVIGTSTYDIDPSLKNKLYTIDYIISILFLIELIIRFFGEKNKFTFLKDGWNLFDTIIVFISLIPSGISESILLLRVLRIFRVLRLIYIFPELKRLIETLFQSLKGVGFVILLLFIIMYIYAGIGSILFEEYDHSRWGDLGTSIITLVQILTLSGWEEIMQPIQEEFWWAWVYFFSFILIGSLILMNLFIAILVDALNEHSSEK